MKDELVNKLVSDIGEAILSLQELQTQVKGKVIDPKQIDRVARDLSLMCSVMKDVAYELDRR